MSLELFVIGILVILILAQNIFWARVNYNLMNRLMSRDYTEYAHAKKIEINKQEPQTLQSLQEEAIDPESERQAQELNSIFNMA